MATPFLGSWWVENAAAGRTAIVCCVEGGRLVGGAAFEIDRFGPSGLKLDRVRFVGQGELAPDHLDVIATEGRRHDVTEAVVDWLKSAPRLVDLDGLSAASTLPRRLGARVLAEVPAPYLELKDEEWTQKLPGRLRSTISRSRKRLERAGFTVRQVHPSRIDRAMQTLLDLHEERWREDSAIAAVWDRLDRVARAGAGCGGVVIHELAAEDGTVIASEMELVVAQRVCFYQAGRLTDHEYRGSGSVLRAAIANWVLESGHDEFDLLRGGESYKEDWATGTRIVRRARTGTGVYPRLASASANSLAVVAPALHRAATRTLGEERAKAMTGRVTRMIRH